MLIPSWEFRNLEWSGWALNLPTGTSALSSILLDKAKKDQVGQNPSGLIFIKILSVTLALYSPPPWGRPGCPSLIAPRLGGDRGAPPFLHPHYQPSSFFKSQIKITNNYR